MSHTPQVPLLLCGPTAVGKTAIALELARRLNAEIISVDSMQVYRGMDIGTAKPSPAERAEIPHHLLDVIGLDQAFDASSFVRLATQSVSDIRSRGRLPLFCGGTGLYFKAYLSGLGDAPQSDPVVREQIRTTPIEELLAELERMDPDAFNKIDRKNPRRVIRAIEVIRLTGKPFSAQRSAWSDGHEPSLGVCIGLSRVPSDLHERINARVDQMFREGLIEETKRLLEQGLETNINALQALGYRQAVDHIMGRMTLEETIELVKARTRKFAKRQLTWFRRQLQVQWVNLDPGTTVAEASDRVIEVYAAGRPISLRP